MVSIRLRSSWAVQLGEFENAFKVCETATGDACVGSLAQACGLCLCDLTGMRREWLVALLAFPKGYFMKVKNELTPGTSPEPIP
jgi:hypothetical protein